MDELARLEPYVGKEKIIEVWGHQIGKSWIVLEKVVDDERKKDKSSEKWKAFKDMGEETVKKI